jgi:hypothetical protein
MRFRVAIPDYLYMIPIMLAIILSVAAFGAQTKTPPSKAPSSKPVASQGTSSQEDKAIESAIRLKLAKSKIGKDGFTVRVQGGVASWEGATGVVQHKGAATRMAKSAGAKRVVNNIQISDQAKEKAAGNLEQGRRRAQVKRSDPRSE